MNQAIRKKILCATVCLLPILIAIGISSLQWIKLVRVYGESMESTLHQGDFLLFTKFHTIQRGDVVVARSPDSWPSKNKLLIKRAVAIPGDEVEIGEKELVINQKEHISFSHFFKNKNPVQFTVPDDFYFLVGDNMGHSYDSLLRFFATEGKETDFLIPKTAILFGKDIPRGRTP